MPSTLVKYTDMKKLLAGSPVWERLQWELKPVFIDFDDIDLVVKAFKEYHFNFKMLQTEPLCEILDMYATHKARDMATQFITAALILLDPEPIYAPYKMKMKHYTRSMLVSFLQIHPSLVSRYAVLGRALLRTNKVFGADVRRIVSLAKLYEQERFLIIS